MPEQTEELAAGYEQDDGKTVGCMLGGQFANPPIGSGGLGTIKVVAKGLTIPIQKLTTRPRDSLFENSLPSTPLKKYMNFPPSPKRDEHGNT